MASILAIGTAGLDIINVVDGYPAEDTEVRALAQRRCRGGNATNTLVVLSQLGHRCSWGGVLADEPDAGDILAELGAHDIDLCHCQRLAAGKVPTSYVTLNRRNGSRTIVHYRDLPEFSYEAFGAIDLRRFDWIHFEGRNIAATADMLRAARQRHPAATRSLEVEKPRPGIETLFALAEVLLFSRDYARAQGCDDAATWLAQARVLAPQSTLVCAWGAQGAFALGRDEVLLHAPAFAPPSVIDTLGAGDVFNAGLIHRLVQVRPLAEALSFGCRIAGHKCGRHGLTALFDPADSGGPAATG
jgi:ketohexokinase